MEQLVSAVKVENLHVTYIADSTGALFWPFVSPEMRFTHRKTVKDDKPQLISGHRPDNTGGKDV